jgi:DNA-binding GntR family transcriptional regulator
MILNRTVLRDNIKEILVARILDGTYKPGERLIETQIAQELGTSQTPVREALRDLASLRMIETEPYRGARVRALSKEELAESYPVRAVLEELAGQLAAVRLAGGVALLREEFEAMKRASAANDLHEQVHHDVEFHRLIVEASGNNTLIEMWGSLRVEVRTFISALSAGLDLEMLAETHRPILDALASGDSGASGRALRTHVEMFADLFRKGMHE